MKIIANWKANMTLIDLQEWINIAFSQLTDKELDHVEVILSSSYPYLSYLKQIKQKKRIFVCAEDISKYEDGPHTGEVTGRMLKDFADYVIIGHSERRKENDTFTEVNMKLDNAIKSKLQPIVCFSGFSEYKAVVDFLNSIHYPSQNVPFAYEPIDSIGNNNPASIESIENILGQCGLKTVIYGGSVTSSSIKNYIGVNFINGFLVGGSSLDALEFVKIVKYFS